MAGGLREGEAVKLTFLGIIQGSEANNPKGENATLFITTAWQVDTQWRSSFTHRADLGELQLGLELSRRVPNVEDQGPKPTVESLCL